MGQLEDFRASLKKKDSAVSSEGEIPVKSIAKARDARSGRARRLEWRHDFASCLIIITDFQTVKNFYVYKNF